MSLWVLWQGLIPKPFAHIPLFRPQYSTNGRGLFLILFTYFLILNILHFSFHNIDVDHRFLYKNANRKTRKIEKLIHAVLEQRERTKASRNKLLQSITLALF